MVTGELKTLRITLEAIEGGVLGYVYLREKAPDEQVRTVEIEPGSIMADYGAGDELLGVEFLNAEEADARVMHRLAEQLGATELAGLDLAEISKARV